MESSKNGCNGSERASQLDVAIELRERGQYADARQWLQQYLSINANDVEALALLGHILLLLKDEAKAEAVLERAAGIDAKHPAVLRNQARLRLKQNKTQEALVLAEAAYACDLSLENRLVRAAVLLALQRSEESGREIDAIIAIKPDYAEAWANRALLVLRNQKIDEAIEAAERALDIKPHLAQVWKMLATLRMQYRHDLSGAIEALERAIAIEPDDVACLADLGEFLRRAKRLEEAIRVLERAVTLDAKSYAAWVNYGTALQEAQRLEEAQAAYEKAQAINPRSAEIANNLGAMAKDREDWEEALRYFEQALTEKPDHAEILSNKSVALYQLGYVEKAEELALLTKDKADARLKCRLDFFISLLMPQIHDSRQDIDLWRARYSSGIDKLKSVVDQINDPLDFSNNAFYLAYHDADDKPLMEALCRLFRAKAPVLNFQAPHVAGWQMPTKRRIHLGIISDNFHTHPVGRFIRYFLIHLDRRIFEITVIYPRQTKKDALTQEIIGRADRHLAIGGPLRQQFSDIAALELDVLFYPNVQESNKTYFLAYGRLALVQFASWGIADTTGIDTIDYYYSSALIEPEGTVAHYSEHLILASCLPCPIAFYLASSERKTRADFGLPEDGRIYLCAQSLFKIHPDFDAVLQEICRLDPEGHLVFIKAKIDAQTQRLRERWSRNAPELNKRVIWLPRQRGDVFFELLNQADVLLDPIHFGSGTTFFETMLHGVPIITWPGRFMRARIVAGGYRQMGLSDEAPIAASLDTYAATAVAWAKDKERCQAFRQRAKEVSKVLFGTDAARQLETFIIAALEAAASGERLPSGWRVPRRDAYL